VKTAAGESPVISDDLLRNQSDLDNFGLEIISIQATELKVAEGCPRGPEDPSAQVLTRNRMSVLPALKENRTNCCLFRQPSGCVLFWCDSSAGLACADEIGTQREFAERSRANSRER